VVFSFNGKTQVRALDRTQPSLPMKRGRGATVTRDYKRHGATDLFAAMNVAPSPRVPMGGCSHRARCATLAVQAILATDHTP
jgi:hypothetical protein